MTGTIAWRGIRSSLLALLIVIGCAAAWGDIASARQGDTSRAGRSISRFNGIWSVLIVTMEGPCDRALRYPILIQNGIVRHADPSDRSFAIFGRVAPNGNVHVGVSRGEQRADGIGRLSGNVGEGRWSSPAGCEGSWSAERRG
jgi:hypothetical protein